MSEREFDGFVAEAEELLEEASNDIFELENSFKEGEINPERLNNLFRNIHSIKGSAAMFDFQQLNDAAHYFEDFLDKLRMGKIKFDNSIFDLLNKIIELLQNMLRKKSQEDQDYDKTTVNGYINQLLTRIAKPQETNGQVNPNDFPSINFSTLTDYELHRLHESVKAKRPIYKVQTVFNMDKFQEGNDKIRNILEKAGEILFTQPGKMEPEDNIMGIDFILAIKNPIGFKTMIDLAEKFPRMIQVEKCQKNN